jgi:DNA-binding NarL/FixJ family response regulator
MIADLQATLRTVDGPKVAIRVLIGDGDAATRAELRQTVESDSRFVCVAEVSHAPGAVEEAVRSRPDVCLLAVELPGNGISAAWEICSRLPESGVVMLTDSGEERQLFAALNAGATGYLPRSMDRDRLTHVLAGVAQGETAIPRSLMRHVVDRFRDRGARRRTVVPEINGIRLTSREWQVLALLCERRSTAEIARQLIVSPATVRTHVASIVRKLRVTDRKALLALFDQKPRAKPSRSGQPARKAKSAA